MAIKRRSDVGVGHRAAVSYIVDSRGVTLRAFSICQVCVYIAELLLALLYTSHLYIITYI